MTQTTNDHFNISDVSQHVKRWITNNWLQWSYQPEIYNFDNSFDNRVWQLTCDGVCGVNHASYDGNLLTYDPIYNLRV